MARSAATSVLLQMLTLFDELEVIDGAELHVTLERPSGGVESLGGNLHEQLGDVMDEEGMDTDSWW